MCTEVQQCCSTAKVRCFAHNTEQKQSAATQQQKCSCNACMARQLQARLAWRLQTMHALAWSIGLARLRTAIAEQSAAAPCSCVAATAGAAGANHAAALPRLQCVSVVPCCPAGGLFKGCCCCCCCCCALHLMYMCPAALQVDLSRSFDHCGICGNSRAHDNAVTACVNNHCKLRSCIAPFVNCDGDLSNGCEAVLASSVDNCGACGNVCSSAGNVVATCTAGTCGWTDCVKGYTNCYGDSSDGCEVRGQEHIHLAQSVLLLP
jgi:hypothetical protein